MQCTKLFAAPKNVEIGHHLRNPPFLRDPTSSNDPFYEFQQMSCLGAFGGAVYPDVVFRRFNGELTDSQSKMSVPLLSLHSSTPSFLPLSLIVLPNGKPNFQNATRLVISIPVQDNQLAKIWGKGFQEYIKLYSGKYIDISSAEVGVQGQE